MFKPKKKYEYKDFRLGEEVIVNNQKCRIVDFDFSLYSDLNVAIDSYLSGDYLCFCKHISLANIDNGVYLDEDINKYTWVSFKEITKQKKEEKCLFKVKQRVWDFSRGYGTVNCIIDDEKAKYPVVVVFDNGDTVYFTIDGKQYKRCNRTLFFEEISIPESALNPKRWRAQKRECYFIVNTSGKIDVVCEDNVGIDDERYKIGNYFQTKEEAENSDLYKVFQQMKGEL